MKRKLITCFLLLTGFVHAQTYVSGGIYNNTTWTKANSPYIVTDQLVLFPDYTLTIEPGVTIKFDDSVGLECRGKLVAIGMATDSISFTSNVAAPVVGNWPGIKVVNASSYSLTEQVRMEYCKGMYAVNFIDLDIAYHGPYIFNHCYFYKNQKVNYDGGTVGTYFDSCKFEANVSALNYIQFGGRVSHSEFFDNENAVDGFEHVDSCVFYNNTNIALSPYGSATGNKVYHNNIGVRCYFNSVNNKFVGNEVHDNTVGVDLLTFFNGYINFQKNSICNNSLYNIKNSSANDADLSNNCWCSTDSLQVRQSIFDGYVDPSVGLVSFTYQLNCADTVAVTDTTEAGDTSTVAPRVVTNGMKIFPNPAVSNSGINVAIDKDISAGVLYIFNAMGVNIYKQNFSGTAKSIHCPLSKGLYFIQVNDGKQVWIKRIYVQ